MLTHDLPLPVLLDFITDECAALLGDAMHARGGKDHLITAEQVEAISSYVGPVVARRALRQAGFHLDLINDNWFAGKYFEKNVLNLSPEDFGIARDLFDPADRLGVA